RYVTPMPRRRSRRRSRVFRRVHEDEHAVPALVDLLCAALQGFAPLSCCSLLRDLLRLRLRGIGVTYLVGTEPGVGQNLPGLVETGHQPGSGVVEQGQGLDRSARAPACQTHGRIEGASLLSLDQVGGEETAHRGGRLRRCGGSVRLALGHGRALPDESLPAYTEAMGRSLPTLGSCTSCINHPR